MARQVRAVFDRVILARDWGYDTVLDLDSGFRTILDELPERWTLAADEQEDPMLRFQRHFVLEGLHNRIFRLHRPLLSKAHKNPKYKFSAVRLHASVPLRLSPLTSSLGLAAGGLPQVGTRSRRFDAQVSLSVSLFNRFERA